jgi:hypothetical protein
MNPSKIPPFRSNELFKPRISISLNEIFVHRAYFHLYYSPKPLLISFHLSSSSRLVCFSLKDDKSQNHTAISLDEIVYHLVIFLFCRISKTIVPPFELLTCFFPRFTILSTSFVTAFCYYLLCSWFLHNSKGLLQPPWQLLCSLPLSLDLFLLFAKCTNTSFANIFSSHLLQSRSFAKSTNASLATAFSTHFHRSFSFAKFINTSFATAVRY